MKQKYVILEYPEKRPPGETFGTKVYGPYSLKDVFDTAHNIMDRLLRSEKTLELCFEIVELKRTIDK